MSDNSAIEWTDATWNPVTGCTKVSPGCDNCYAETFAERWRGTPGHHFENGFDVTLRPERISEPLKWRKPRKVFVNSMSDLFHDAVPNRFIADVFAVMAATPQHTYQVLTKRHGRMRSLLNDGTFRAAVEIYLASLLRVNEAPMSWPLPNVWLGVSVEDQKRADLRIPALLDTPAAVRFLSCEPLLGPVDLDRTRPHDCATHRGSICPPWYSNGIDWVIVGGESGPKARPMHPDWARSLRDQCEAAGVPYFFKQWGAYRWVSGSRYNEAAQSWEDYGIVPQRVGKKLAGRLLDGRTWDEFPEPVPA